MRRQWVPGAFAGTAAALSAGAFAAGAAACGSTTLEAIASAPGADAGTPEAAVPSAPADASDAAAPGITVFACKRGIAANSAPSDAMAPGPQRPGIVWWYNWASQPAAGAAPGIEFVPMVWGGGSLTQTVPAGAKTLLGFNEPNFKTQADLTASRAAADWPAVEGLASPGHLAIASPGVDYCGSAADASQCTDPSVTDPYTYLTGFFAACTGCQVDYVAVHAYDCDLDSLRSYIEGNLDAGGTTPGYLQFGRPIWVTELACDATHSVADQMAFMQAAIPYLEGNPNVLRYAWFSADPIPNALLTASDGGLTELGSTYVSLPANCP